MKPVIKTTVIVILLSGTAIHLPSCNNNNKTEIINSRVASITTGSLAFQSGYSEVNGLKMYYEIYGHGKPIVLIHGGGSTIQTTFEKAIPLFAKNRKVVAVELQAHGRTKNRDADLSFEQDADDIAHSLKI
jgi:hypothetical protein